MRTFFQRLFGKRIPQVVNKRFTHQWRPAHIHPVFGRIAPFGTGWRNQVSKELEFDGEPKQVSIDYCFEAKDSALTQNNFLSLSGSIDAIARQFVAFVLADAAELEVEASPWTTIFLDLTVPDCQNINEIQWVGGGGVVTRSNEWQLFFQGLELKGIVPIWNDPVVKGFEDWGEMTCSFNTVRIRKE